MYEREDVDVDLMLELANGKKHGSNLAWADFIRNVCVFDLVRHSEPRVLVDVGFGTSFWLARWIDNARLDVQYRGIDVSHERVVAAHSHAWNGRRLPEFYELDMSSPVAAMPAWDDEANFVVCLEAMEHFCSSYDDVERFIVEVKRVLARNGTFVLATPNRGDDNVPLMHPNCHDWEGTHERLHKLLKEHLYVQDHWTYRARPYDVHPPTGRLPLALRSTLSLMHGTSSFVVPPGNVVYVCTRNN